jgi:iron complex outermembrane receptor protein
MTYRGSEQRGKGRKASILGLFLVLAGAGSAFPAEVHSPSVPDFTQFTLEELANYPVTSVSKSEEKLSTAAAAIHVITQDDIRRSGVTSIPEALRLAPGLQVARVNAHTWGISARGFNDVFANKLLVLQDGRSVYTPLFSGVYWDAQDTLLEDIDRIEVIRGPGATLWGANAVNGVINIITKGAKDTQGVLITGGSGTEEHLFGGVRYGGKIGEDAYFRVYGKYFSHDDSALPFDGDANDNWQMSRGGFRFDWDATEINHLTFQGDIYGGTYKETYLRVNPTLPFTPFFDDVKADISGGNLLGRWTHTFGAESALVVQTYYDRTIRNSDIFEEDRQTWDIEAQQRFTFLGRHDVIVGLGYRLMTDETDGSFDVSLDPQERTTDLFNAFVQDKITLIEDRLWFTAGSKFEHNDYTGFEVQPSGRFTWVPHEQHTLWASVARAVRTPSRAESDVRLNEPSPVSPFIVTSIFGSSDYRSEELLAYELGYRVQPEERVSFDLALFYNDYDDLRSVELRGPQPGPPPHIALVAGNHLEGITYGGELAVNYQAAKWWRLRAAYSYLQMEMETKDDSTDTTSAADIEGSSPEHQVSLISSIELPDNISLDLWARYVDRLPARDIDSYFTFDARLAWRPTENLEFALVGQNLWDNRHPEFSVGLVEVQRTEVERSVYAKITWRF